MSKFKTGCLTLLCIFSALFGYFTGVSGFYVLTGATAFFLIADGS